LRPAPVRMMSSPVALCSVCPFASDNDGQYQGCCQAQAAGLS
jgi:hypothetical protein